MTKLNDSEAGKLQHDISKGIFGNYLILWIHELWHSSGIYLECDLLVRSKNLFQQKRCLIVF